MISKPGSRSPNWFCNLFALDYMISPFGGDKCDVERVFELFTELIHSKNKSPLLNVDRKRICLLRLELFALLGHSLSGHIVSKNVSRLLNMNVLFIAKADITQTWFVIRSCGTKPQPNRNNNALPWVILPNYWKLESLELQVKWCKTGLLVNILKLFSKRRKVEISWTHT